MQCALKRLVVISTKLKLKDGKSELTVVAASRESIHHQWTLLALFSGCYLRFTSWRGNLSASPSAKPSGCDRAGGVKFTGWRMSRLELLLTQ